MPYRQVRAGPSSHPRAVIWNWSAALVQRVSIGTMVRDLRISTDDWHDDITEPPSRVLAVSVVTGRRISAADRHPPTLTRALDTRPATPWLAEAGAMARAGWRHERWAWDDRAGVLALRRPPGLRRQYIPPLDHAA